MSKKTWKVAFNKLGDHFSNPRWAYPAEELTYKDPYDFHAILRYITCEPINSGTAFKWIDVDKKIIYISSTEMVDHVIREDLIHDGLIRGDFEFYKKGTSTFIRMI